MSYTIGTPYALDIDDYAIPVYMDGHDVAYIYLNGVDDLQIHFHTRSFVPEDASRELLAGMGMFRPDILRELQSLNGVAAPVEYVTPAPAVADEVVEDIAINRAEEGGTLWSVPEKMTGFVVGGRIPELVFPEDTENAVIAELVANHFSSYRTAVITADCAGWWTFRGNIHVDVNDWVETLETARALGMARGELAIWDIARGVEITL